MSAFIVSEKTMHTCVAAILAVNMRTNVVFQFNETTYFPRDTASIKEAGTAIGHALYQLNSAAVKARYGHREDDFGDCYTFDSNAEITHRDWMGPIMSAQHMKAIGCLLYQCSEGNVPDTTLFKELETYEGKIAKLLVVRTK